MRLILFYSTLGGQQKKPFLPWTTRMAPEAIPPGEPRAVADGKKMPAA